MCLIIDNNTIGEVVSRRHPDLHELHDMLLGPKASNIKIVYGGKLKREYFVSPKIRKIILLLDQAGKAHQESDTTVDSETTAIKGLTLCKSDDEHIIALARISGVRLLCSFDQALHADFTNKSLLDNPRGKVYQNPNHNHLLKEMCQG